VYVFFFSGPVGLGIKYVETLSFYNYCSELEGRDLGGMGALGNQWHSAFVEAKVYVFFLAERLGLVFFNTSKRCVFHFYLKIPATHRPSLPSRASHVHIYYIHIIIYYKCIIEYYKSFKVL